MTISIRITGLLLLFAVVLSACPLASIAADSEQITPAAEPAALPSEIGSFLNTWCVKCHGPQKQKADARFDTLAGDIHDDGTLVDYQDILDQLNLEAMPPEEAAQPPAEQRRQVIDWFTQRVQTHHAGRSPSGQGTVLRRLNSREYRNTIRDLLQLDMSMFDPTAAFPRDQLDEHLDNVGESLVVSGHLLNRYLDAAELVIDKALLSRDPPPVQKWVFRDRFRQQPEIDKVHDDVNGFSHLTLYDVKGADKLEGAYGPILAFREGVPCDGFYDLRFTAEAVNRINPYDPEFLGLDPDEPLRLGIVVGSQQAGPLHKPQPIEPLLAEFELADEPRPYTVRVWLDRGLRRALLFRTD